MTDQERDLSRYRLDEAKDSLKSAKLCLEQSLYKDSINYFNQHYIATEIFSKDLGRLIGRCKRKRETSDYDDFYVASKEEAQEQLNTAKQTLMKVCEYLGME